MNWTVKMLDRDSQPRGDYTPLHERLSYRFSQAMIKLFFSLHQKSI